MPNNFKIEFSAIVPSYNRANFLPRALESILVQSYPAREIIVVDDGSSDSTAHLIRERYPQVRYHYQRHAGVSAARNHGIANAKSQWIALLDSDDEWHPDKLGIQADAIRGHRGIRLIHTNENWFRNGLPVGQKAHQRKISDQAFEHCLGSCVIAASSCIIRQDLFADVGFFDESLKACEDYDLWLRICAREPVMLLDQALVARHSGHSGQLSQSSNNLDRYRIRAWCKLISSGVLTHDQRKLAENTLRQKSRIYTAGAMKRGRRYEAAKYRSIVAALINA